MLNKTIKTCISEWSSTCDILDIELIISHVIKKDRVFVITYPKYTITPKEYNHVTQLCKKRALYYPLAYITGNKEFYGRNFNITEHTLVPRPETELLVENVLSFIATAKISDVLIIDIGTGSGIIPITLAKEQEDNEISLRILASDLSKDALVVAEQNAKLHDIKTIKFYHADLLQNSKLQSIITHTKYDHIIITANLPYIDIATKNTLLQQSESKSLYHEPSIALWSNDSGLTHYKKLITQTIKLCKKMNHKKIITSFYEIDPDQSKSLTNHLHKILPANITIMCTKDLAKKDRVLQWKIR